MPRRKSRATFESDSEFEPDEQSQSNFGSEVVIARKNPRNTVDNESCNPIQIRGKKETSKSSFRLENLRERLEVFYGNSDEELVEAIKLRARWGAINFSMLPDMVLHRDDIALSNEKYKIEPSLLSELHVVSDVQMKDYKFNGFSCAVDGVSLDPFTSRTNGVSTILNTGYTVISIDSRGIGSTSVLAVCLLASEIPPMDVSTLTSLGEGPSFFHIYSVEGAKIALSSIIWSDQGWGTPVCVKWRPGSNDLAATFGNGLIALLTAPNCGRDSNKETGKCFQVNMKPLLDLGKATKLCWRTPQNLVVGYESGYIAEFDVSDPDITPSYHIKAHHSVISALSISSPNHPNLIFSSSVDGFSAVHDITDLRNTLKTPRSRLFSQCSAYAELLGSFVTSEDGDTTKLVPLRLPDHPLNVANLTRHNGLVTCVSTTSSHPLIASGGQDGTVHLTNGLKRTMVTRRQKDVMEDITLWQLECSHKTGEYRFRELNDVKPLKNRKMPSVLPIFPPSVTITGLTWQGSWLISATSSGLVRLDNIIS